MVINSKQSIINPEPYEPLKVIIIFVDIIRVSRLVIDSKGSIMDVNGTNWVLYATTTKKTRMIMCPKPYKPQEVIIINAYIIKVSSLVVDSKGNVINTKRPRFSRFLNKNKERYPSLRKEP